jgi:uncharacterized membrane protein
MRIALAVFFAAAGAAHFARPRFFLEIVPPWVPFPAFWVHFTGACEILGGMGVLIDPLRPVARWCLIALLVGVFPANVHMLRVQYAGSSAWKRAALIARLPAQLLLIAWVYAAAS